MPLIHACDFCGRPLQPVVLERLGDGRERCSVCGGTAADTPAELAEIYREARRFLTEELGLRLRHRVSVTYGSSEQIARLAGSAFSRTSGFDTRAIGFALFDGEDCTILIEDQQPYHLSLATAVHELVHVWQADHLDLDGIESAGWSPLIEGLAVWAEIECLKRRHLAPDYVLELIGRDDAYGIGYREVVKTIGPHAEERNIFELLARRFSRSQGGEDEPISEEAPR